MRLFVLFAALTILAACSPADAPAPSDPEPPIPAPAPALSETLAVEAGASFAGLPTRQMRIEGACPFECCRYGRWTTTEATRVFERPGDTTSVVFILPAGTTVDAVEGHLLLDPVGVAVARGDVPLYRGYEDQRILSDGDTVRVLDYVGEGFHHVWLADTVYQAEGPYAPGADYAPGTPDGPEVGLLWIEETHRTWWARIRLEDGRTGWLWMDRTPRIDGVDTCA